MFLINIRRDGIHGNTFSSSQRFYRLNTEMRLKEITESQLMQTVEKKNILMLIHGFNNPIEDILELYSDITSQHHNLLRESYDAIVGFVWPGGESELSYFWSKRNARLSAPYLKSWLNRFKKAKC